jgi:hypothetical protein
MSDEPIEPTPAADPDASPEPVPRGELPRGRIGVGISNVSLVAIVFVATLLLLLGATRLVDRGRVEPGSTSNGGVGAVPTAGPSVASGASLAAGPSTSPVTGTATTSGTPGASPTGDPVLVGAGDIGQCDSDGDEDTAALLDGIPGTVFTAGDNAYENGTAEQFRDCYAPSWGRHLARTRPAPGNHDWETANLAAYFEYFGDAAKGPGGSSWYSYDLGTWHVIVLDSMCTKVGGCEPASRQGQWLAADLAASDATCTLAIFHHPRFTSGEHGNTEAMDGFWRPLYAAGVDVVVNGHDHDYEWFDPQDPDGRADPARGIRQFIVGTGGAPLRDFPRVAPNSAGRVSIAHGVLAFALHEGSYGWQFIAARNDFRQLGVAPCH